MRNVEGQLLRRPGGHGALLPLLEKVQPGLWSFEH